MEKKFVFSLLAILAAAALSRLVLPIPPLASGIVTLVLGALVVGLFLFLTRDRPLAGVRAKRTCSLILFVGFCFIGSLRGIDYSLAAVLAVPAFLLLEAAAIVWLIRRYVRCPSCGKRIPFFGDDDRCPHCGAALEENATTT